jgi:hypothetical protein
MSTKVVEVVTDAAGAFSTDISLSGEVMAVGVLVGTLSTPDVTITDKDTGATLFAKAGIASDGKWQPREVAVTTAGVATADTAGPPITMANYVAPFCMRHAHIVVAGAGDTRRGTIFIAYR